MSAGARARRERELISPEATEASAPEPRTRIQAYAETKTGIHAIALDEAVALFLECQRATSADDTSAPVVWIDVASPTETEAEFLRSKLGFHPLAVEDCVRGRQRPKLDRYPGYFFLVLYSAAINPERARMALHEVHIFLGRRYIVTVHDHRITEFSEVLARWRAAPASFRTVGAIAHAIMDAIVDDYFPVLDHFAERVEEVEAGVFRRDPAGDRAGMENILGLRRELTLFRKILGPERELLSSLLRRDLPFLSPELMPYFQDVYDHAMRAVEEIDTMRDLLSVAIEGHISLASNQLNEIMRVMAAWSIILMAMAWIAGIYGMNFTHMPELKWPLGYAWALGIMLSVGFALFMYFRRRGWI
ncbi:MAG TPA: magnesium/cobalt transporter CorA [Longimicrobiaceae bacterium]|nr:magnesium/cobalt transporter CorA [Longimicrobiaceae bacterium]